MAVSKERKADILEEYRSWLSASRAMFLAEYTGVSMKQLDDLRANLREIGAEFHIIKNTLGKLAFEEAGLEVDDSWFTGSTAVGFAFEDSPGAAKALSDFAGQVEFIKIKGGFLGDKALTSQDVKALADLPPLPVVRAQLLGVLQAPASRLLRTLAEPGRQIAAVLQANADKDAAAA